MPPEQENSGLVREMWTPVDFKLPGWVTSAWPKPAEKLFKDFFSCVTFNILLSDVFYRWDNDENPSAMNVISSCTTEEKIGYFNLVTRALDDCELKTCKQRSRALGVCNAAKTPRWNISSAYELKHTEKS